MTCRRHTRPSADELKLWQAVTRDVEPLTRQKPPAADPSGGTGTTDESPAAAETGKARHHAARRPGRGQTAPMPPKPAVPPPRLGPGQAPGVDRRTADRLRRGRLAVDGRLDLHGMTQHAAHEALIRFVLDGHARGRRTLLVITGKGTFGDGRGILRARVPDWLNDAPLRDKVLAIATAQPKDGGSGALYVLLKRKREG